MCKSANAMENLSNSHIFHMKITLRTDISFRFGCIRRTGSLYIPFFVHWYDDNHIMRSAMINDDIKRTRLFATIAIHLDLDFRWWYNHKTDFIYRQSSICLKWFFLFVDKVQKKKIDSTLENFLFFFPICNEHLYKPQEQQFSENHWAYHLLMW